MSSERDGMSIRVRKEEVIEFATRCLVSVGTCQSHAKELAEVLAAGDHRGHFSHGLNRLDMYIKEIQTKMSAPDGTPEIVNETLACALVDGKNLLGPVVGNFCTELAIKKAKEAGIGWVVAHSSNHYGIAGYYSIKICDEGLLGMSFTSCSPLQVPTRAKTPTLGTNPITLAAPGKNGDAFVLDMATSTAPIGKVEINDRKQIPIPDAWGVDKNGKVTTDPKEVLDGGGLLPLGGAEETGGYKGYGLAMMVEIFCGILGNAAYGPNIRKWKETERLANLGQCFVAINPDAFAPGFRDRMSDLMDHCRGLEPAAGYDRVLVAGDPERAHMQECNDNGGIPYHPNLVQHMNNLASTLGVQPMKTV